MTISNEDKKHLRRLGHKLNPVVTVAAKGLTNQLSQKLTAHSMTMSSSK